MTTSERQGLSRLGLDEGFAAEEAAKSHLLLEAQWVRAQGHVEQAAEKFALVATAEERLAEQCDCAGLVAKAQVHAFSAASCWAQAGNFLQAIRLCNRLLARTDVPPRLRREVEDYAQRLRNRRAQWYAELAGAVEEAGATV